MSEVETQKFEERIVALELKTEELEQKYQDVAYEYLDGLVKRIETIRDEVNASLSSVEDRVRKEASQKISEAVGEARQNLDRDLSAVVDEHKAALDAHKNKILPMLVDESTGRLRHR
jgi:Mg2+ and Co2+ transporter CorA